MFFASLFPLLLVDEIVFEREKQEQEKQVFDRLSLSYASRCWSSMFFITFFFSFRKPIEIFKQLCGCARIYRGI